ncbi:MAG: aminotransferase class I/II-fold pyridoxal phosphate-dependent enzyme [Thaumarchaeota archaeon]|jgi:aspartate aminotransferase|nr:aminotransferase class I/II-fold pyridoxal phosphate-dependent enzyme [Candidatus Geocrenenecus arthurdayi]
MSGAELKELREEIKKVTREILRLTAKRVELSLKIGDIKSRLGIDISDRQVEAELFNDALNFSGELGLDRDFTSRLISLLISESTKVQVEKTSRTGRIGLREIFYMALELEKSGRRIIRLEIGEPDFTAPPSVVDEACRALREGRSRYLSSYGIIELREAIAKRLNSMYGVDFKPENILVTSGGVTAIYIAVQALSRIGDEVLVPEPAWPLYREIAEHLGRRYVPLRTSIKDKWTVKLGELSKHTTPASKLLILNYPNNPTGRALSLTELKNLVEEARESGLTIISDEVYSQYYFHGRYAPSIAQVLDEGYVLVGSFSKTWGMTGYRIGYLVGDRELIERAAKILGLIMTCIPEFIQRAALKALRDEENIVRNVDEVKKRVRYMYSKLQENSLIEVYPSDGAFYLFPKIKIDGFDSSEFALKLLREYGVAVAPGSSFGEYNQHIRLSAVKPINEIDEGVEKINQAIQQTTQL